MYSKEERNEYNKYHREYKRDRYIELHAWMIAELGGKCARCPATENLEIDHIDHTKKWKNVTNLTTYSKEEIRKELAKCQLLCKPCHTEKTIWERGNTPARGTHGTLSAYRYCKCDRCRGAKRAWYQTWKHRRPSRRRTPTTDSQSVEDVPETKERLESPNPMI